MLGFCSRDVRTHKDVLSRIGFHGMLDQPPEPRSSHDPPQPRSGAPPLSTKKLVDNNMKLGSVPVQPSQRAQEATRHTWEATKNERVQESAKLERSLDKHPLMQELNRAIQASVLKR